MAVKLSIPPKIDVLPSNASTPSQCEMNGPEGICGGRWVTGVHTNCVLTHTCK